MQPRHSVQLNELERHVASENDCPVSRLKLMSRAFAWVACVGMSVALCACGDELDEQAGSAASSVAGAIESPIAVLPNEGSGDFEDVATGGRIVIVDDCVFIDGTPGSRTSVVWPAGTRWDDGARTIVAPGGVEIRSGDTFRANGIDVELSEAISIVDAGGDSYLDRCAEGDAVAIVRGNVRRETAPAGTPPPASPAP